MYKRQVRKSIDHLLYLINDVLDFTKLQSGKLKLESIGFRPNEFVRDVITFVKPLAKEKQIEIKCDIKTDDGLILLGDPFRLRQILLNLISNSIKFTEKGSISVQLTQVMKSSHFTNIRLEITDSGIGMKKEQLKKVFREFEQAEVSTSRNYGGTGLGLSIVSMLVKLHEGKIDIISSPNKGTTVSIEISYPLGTEAEIELYEKVEKESDSNLTLPEGLKILIVDDEEYNRKLLSTILKKYPVSYTEAINGVEAIMEVKRNNYDLILMDARMPKMDGIEATKRIRRLNGSAKSNIPIIALTAAVTEENKKEYKFAGMNGCLAKPFKEKELLQEINNLIELNNNTDTTEAPIDSEKEANSLDLSALKELSNGDKAFYTDMLQTFLQTTTTGISEMEKLLKDKNYEMIAEHAHKISAPCKHLGADLLYNLLKEIEENCRNNTNLDDVSDLIEKMVTEYKTINELINKELTKN